jgi:hypothetical protein
MTAKQGDTFAHAAQADPLAQSRIGEHMRRLEAAAPILNFQP